MIKRHIIATATWLYGLVAAANVVAVGYDNPVIPGFHPDPSVCRVGNDYYLVTSSFQFFPGVPIFHSTDLIHWQQIGNVLDRESQLPLKGANAWMGIYAPTIRYYDGTYYMVTTNVGNGNDGRSNFFVTATDPAGPWSEPIWLEQGAIDPSFYFEDGKCFMTSNPNDGIWLCEVDVATGRQLTESREIWRGTGGRYPEAPHIYKKDGYYYLMIAEGGTEMGHKVTIARSRNIYGPYEANPDNPILTHQKQAAQTNPIQGTGHADLVEAHDGSWWLVCLAFRTQANNLHLTGRETYLAPVEWNDAGWPVVNATGTIYPHMDVPTLPQSAPIDRTVHVDFSKLKKLPPEWVHLRNPVQSNYQLTAEGLRLAGTAIGLNSMESPTFVARRQEDINFTARTTVSLTDAADDVQAGLSVYMDTTSHYDVGLRQLPDGRQMITLGYQLYALSQVIEGPTVDAGANVVLEVRGSDDMYDFRYSVDGGDTFAPIGGFNARYLSTETAGGFTGITLGLYVAGHGLGTFRDFTYLPYLPASNPAIVAEYDPDDIRAWEPDEQPNLTVKLTNKESVEADVRVDVALSTDQREPYAHYSKSVTLASGETRSVDTDFNLAPGFYRLTATANGEQLCSYVIGYDPKGVVSADDSQPDFWDFWGEALAQLAGVDPQYTVIQEMTDKSTASRKVYMVAMKSIPDGRKGDPVTIRGYYAEPVAEGKYPTIIHYQGTDGGTGTPWCMGGDDHQDWCELIISTRGQMLNNRTPYKADNVYGNDYYGYGFGDLYHHYYRGAYIDCVRAIDFMCAQPKVDQRNIFVAGGSQGGSFCYAAAALDSRVAGAAPAITGHSDFPDCVRIVNWPANVFAAKQSELAISDDDMRRFLSYFDVKNFARRISCPVITSFSLQDTVDPPHINIAPFNLLANVAADDKQYVVNPFLGHATAADWPETYLEFFRRHINHAAK